MKQIDDKNSNAGGPARFLRTASFWALIVLIPLAIFQVMDTSRQVEKELTYSEFKAQLDACIACIQPNKLDYILDYGIDIE